MVPSADAEKDLQRPSGGKALLLPESPEQLGAAHDRDTARQCEGALARAQCATCKVQCNERGRASCVDRHCRHLQAKRIGDPAGGHATEPARETKALHALRSRRKLAIWRAAHTHEDPRLAAAHGAGIYTGALKHFPAGFEQQPLLRIHCKGLAWADPKERRIEIAGVIDESAFGGMTCGGASRPTVEERLQVPAPVAREGTDRIGTRRDQAPKLLWGAHTAGVATAHAHDRHRLPRGTACR